LLMKDPSLAPRMTRRFKTLRFAQGDRRREDSSG
jgi:hypothetical protein